jgi:hypothetical protein
MADTKISGLSAHSGALSGTEEVAINDGGVSKKCTIADIRTIDYVTVVGSTFTNSTVTPAAVTDLQQSLVAGTYLIKVWMLMQSAATTTGIGVHLNASGGTVTACAATWYTLTTGTTATSGVMDQASVAATFQTMEGRAQRANNTTGGVFGGVDTANADQFAVLEGIVIVTATTTLQVMLASEVAASAVIMKPGSTMTISKVA